MSTWKKALFIVAIIFASFAAGYTFRLHDGQEAGHRKVGVQDTARKNAETACREAIGTPPSGKNINWRFTTDADTTNEFIVAGMYDWSDQADKPVTRKSFIFICRGLGVMDNRAIAKVDVVKEVD